MPELCSETREDVCPDRERSWLMFMASLPRGRAWQTHDSGIPRDESLLQRFWYAVAGPWTALEEAVCATIDEFFCATATVDLDLWLEEYGLPNDCEPFGEDLCAKVKARGGVSIAYYRGLAEDLGWDTQMRFLKGGDDEFPGVHATLHVTILPTSPNFIEPLDVENWELGDDIHDSVLGEGNGALLVCTLDRVVPAHVAITYAIA